MDCILAPDSDEECDEYLTEWQGNASLHEYAEAFLSEGANEDRPHYAMLSKRHTELSSGNRFSLLAYYPGRTFVSDERDALQSIYMKIRQRHDAVQNKRGKCISHRYLIKPSSLHGCRAPCPRERSPSMASLSVEHVTTPASNQLTPGESVALHFLNRVSRTPSMETPKLDVSGFDFSPSSLFRDSEVSSSSEAAHASQSSDEELTPQPMRHSYKAVNIVIDRFIESRDQKYSEWCRSAYPSLF